MSDESSRHRKKPDHEEKPPRGDPPEGDPPEPDEPYRPDPAHRPTRKRPRASYGAIATGLASQDLTLTATLIAAVGAADLALERVTLIIEALRERAGEARSDAETRIEETRVRVTKLQEDLPTQFGDLRERLSSDELRRFAESYAEAAQSSYNKLVERGEATYERLRTQLALEKAADPVGERAAKLVGVELPKKAQQFAPAKKAAHQFAPAKKVQKIVPAKKVQEAAAARKRVQKAAAARKGVKKVAKRSRRK